MKVLIIEDTIKLADNLKSYFEIAGHTSDVSYTLNDAYDFYSTSHYDIILLDIMLPDGDGREFLKKVRHNNDSKPIIIMTAKSDITDKVDILDLGADDYIIKPFEFSELDERCRDVLRRQIGQSQVWLEFGNIKLYPLTATLDINSKKIILRNRELRLLEIFLNSPDLIFSKNQLTDRVFSISENVNENTIEVYIARIRKLINTSSVMIKTLRGIGYKLEKKNETSF